jgi:hypothetical protein
MKFHDCEKMPAYTKIFVCEGRQGPSELDVYFQNDCTTDYAKSSFAIYYCPFCGKDLKENEEE